MEGGNGRGEAKNVKNGMKQKQAEMVDVPVSRISSVTVSQLKLRLRFSKLGH